MNTVAIIQARISSTRLPNKILAPIAGKPMIFRVCERAKRIVGVNRVVVALGDGDVAAIQAMVRPLGVTVMQGPRDDVLSRFTLVATATNAQTIIRITADCPMLDPAISSRVLHKFQSGAYDYVSNVLPSPSWPDGTDTEVLSRACLNQISDWATDAVDREHVTLYLRRHPEEFKRAAVFDFRDRSDYMWSVNTAEDLEFVRAVYAMLGTDFSASDLFSELRRNPTLAAMMRRNAA